jgi:signal transduction histidine kinase/ActR/RegA family two-component response regulator
VTTVADGEGRAALGEAAADTRGHAEGPTERATPSRPADLLLALAQRLAGSRPEEDLLRVVVEEAIALVGATAAGCRLVDGDALATTAWAGAFEGLATAPHIKADEGLCGLVASRGVALRLADVEREPEMAGSAELARLGVRAYLGVPLLVRDRVVGVLSVYSSERGRFHEDDARLLGGLAAQATLALENARLVQQLLHAERLAALGRIVAGVAHELNNPLSVVLGTAELLRREGVDTPVADRLRRITGQAQRAVRIVRSLLSLARKQPASRAPVDVNRLIDETLELEGYQFRSSRVAVVRDLAPQLPPILADPHQLQQVFTNLFLNALEAMRERGGQATLTVASRVGADRVVVSISDEGPGIAPRDLARVFEPFFTTKRDQKGTGLGLSICRQIVESHHGAIRVESPPGTGATFTVELPIATEGAGGTGQPAPEARAASRGQPVLLVEDDRVVADLLAEFLALDGHQVDRAANGREALELVGRRDYALIVTDIRMPDVDGPALYRELATASPPLTRRILFVTGDVISPETRRFLEETRLVYLEKPFGIGEFHAAVRAILDSPGRKPANRAKTA